MVYQVKLHPKVDTFLKKQDKQIEERIRKRLRALECENPFHYLEHYEGEDCYKFRAGNYRALVKTKIRSILRKAQGGKNYKNK